MSKVKMDNIVFDTLFERVVKDKFAAEIDSIPSNEELAKQYPLSPQFDLRMNKEKALAVFESGRLPRADQRVIRSEVFQAKIDCIESESA